MRVLVVSPIGPEHRSRADLVFYQSSGSPLGTIGLSGWGPDSEVTVEFTLTTRPLDLELGSEIVEDLRRMAHVARYARSLLAKQPIPDVLTVLGVAFRELEWADA